MHVDPAAVLALIAEQQARIMHLTQENQHLREQVSQSTTRDPEGTEPSR